MSTRFPNFLPQKPMQGTRPGRFNRRARQNAAPDMCVPAARQPECRSGHALHGGNIVTDDAANGRLKCPRPKTGGIPKCLKYRCFLTVTVFYAAATPA